MNVFVERVVLAVLATGIGVLLYSNPMGFDNTQRATGILALFFAAYFAAHTLSKRNEKPTSLDAVQSEPGKAEGAPKYSQKTTGDSSPIVNVGNNSSVAVKTGLGTEDAIKIGEALYQARMAEKAKEMDTRLANEYPFGYTICTLIDRKEVIRFGSGSWQRIMIDWKTVEISSDAGTISMILPRMLFDSTLFTDNRVHFNAAVGTKMRVGGMNDLRLWVEVIDHYRDGVVIVLGAAPKK